jgi:hypothetical protein
MCHTVTGVEKQCSGKKQFAPQPFSWLPWDCCTHIKRENSEKTKITHFLTVNKNFF